VKSDPAHPAFFKAALNIAHEIFEGELVVVNLETGRYYAMKGESSDIFKLCLQEACTAEIIAALSSNYTSESPDAIGNSVQDYLENLKVEGIISETVSRPDSAPSPVLEAAEKRPFSTPAFEVHNDMQDLLMLDPIHEVDDAGWPSLKPEQD
jgi:hypothetical protein